MQLGAHKTSVRALPGGLGEEARWGEDLMDVNADTDDWSTYLGFPRDSIPTNLSLSHAQMNLRVRQQSLVALMPLG
jgi:hypothetical protein